MIRPFIIATLVVECLVLTVFAAPSQDDNYVSNYDHYAAQCRAQIGDIPAFSCASGRVIPITVDGKVPGRYTKDMTCDRPALLPNGSQSDGQCVPGSRILNLSELDTQISVMCRQKQIRAKDSLSFDEIDVIAHNPISGATCWFQASATQGGSIDGASVPSPTGADGSTFFNPPEDVVKDGCGICHDNDPFMYSPFMGQVWSQVPVNPFGPYYQVNTPVLGFDKWPTQQMQPRDSTCTGCHRIGTKETCGQLADWASGEAPPGANALAKSYPLSHSMPPFHGQSLATWEVINQASVARIGACCADPTSPACNLTEIAHYFK